MTQEDKELLLKDLCARLPYKVKVEAFPYVYPQILCSIDPIRKEFRLDFGEYRNIFATNWVGEEYSIIKPYLRPMSSMTEEEYISLYSMACEKKYQVEYDFSWYSDFKQKGIIPGYIFNPNQTDFLISRHLDFRGLIPMGLALESLEGMYKTK
jgi:hypothetical protein